MTLYIIGYILVAVATGTVVFNHDEDLRGSIAVALIWPLLFILAAIQKLLT